MGYFFGLSSHEIYYNTAHAHCHVTFPFFFLDYIFGDFFPG